MLQNLENLTEFGKYGRISSHKNVELFGKYVIFLQEFPFLAG